MKENTEAVGNSQNSRKSGRRPTTRTSKRTVGQELEILTQALHNVEVAGVALEAKDDSSGTITVAIHGVALVDGIIVPLDKSATKQDGGNDYQTD